MENTNIVLGSGLAFPFVIVNGAVKVSSFDEIVEASIKHTLYWEYGSRFFQPTFGCRIWETIGEPNDTVAVVLVKKFITTALESWEGRITLLDVSINMPTAYSLDIQLQYYINAIQEVRDLNFQYKI